MAFVNGGELVVRALEKEGVSHLFTLCGGHIQAIYDAALNHDIRVVDVRHEQSAGHAADGWARVTGQPGVAAVTAGPGVTDTVTAAANALRAQVPMVLLGGQAARAFGPMGGVDRGGLQDMNHLDLMRAVTKWSASVPEVRRIPEYVQTAFRKAVSGVPGPVFLELPIDMLFGGCDESEVIQYPGYRVDSTVLGDPRKLDDILTMLMRAERPVLIVGSQWRWSGRREGLNHFLEKASMPAFLNGMARGALPSDFPGHFKRARSAALKKTDFVLLFGTPLDFRLGYGEKIPENATLVRVDLDPSEIGHNRTVDIGLVGDIGWALHQLADKIIQKPNWNNWLAHVAEIENDMMQKTLAEAESDAEPINPLRLCAEVNRFVDDKTIVVGDGGDFVATAAYLLDVQGPGSWMDPGPLGTLGVGPGYAMAAKLARPDHKVILMLGDGSFGFNGMDFESMARQGIKVVGIVGNDARWTQIWRGQTAMYGPERAVATELNYARYDKVVEGLGGHGEYVEKLADLGPALERAFASDKPALVNVKIGQSDFRKGAIAI